MVFYLLFILISVISVLADCEGVKSRNPGIPPDKGMDAGIPTFETRPFFT